MLNYNLNSDNIYRENMIHDKTSLHLDTVDSQNEAKFNQHIDHIKEIYRTKYLSTPKSRLHGHENDYLTACVNQSAHLPPCLPPRNNQVRLSPDSLQRNIFGFLLNQWFQLNHESIGDNIRIKLMQCVLYFLHEYEKTHYSGTPDGNPVPLEQAFTLPSELEDILPSGILVEKVLLEAMIYLLSQEKANFSCTPALLYDHQRNRNRRHGQKYLEEDREKRFNIAQAKLKNLSVGHYLMMPLLSLDTGEDGLMSLTGHFSAILVEKTMKGFVFNIIDSFDSGTENEDKEKLIKLLNDCPNENEIRYFGSQFQFNNDCGIHMYNFFSLCIRAPSATLSEAGKFRQMIDRYILNIHALKLLHGKESSATSRLLRIFFVLDGLKSGYSRGMADDFNLLNKIYQVDESVASGAVARGLTRSASFWQRLRRSSSLTFRSWNRRCKSDSSAT